jgi:hypothetical protein
MYPTSENLAQAVKRNRATRGAADFIQQYRSSLDPGVFASGKYAFKAFLIQVANHPSEDALAIQFKNYDKLSEAEKAEVDKLVVSVKYKHVPVANLDTLRAGIVCQRVQKALGGCKDSPDGKKVNKYNLDWHARCWQHFKVRPSSKSPSPEQTDTRYCIYDKRHNDYGYTVAWADMLIEKFRDEGLYETLYARKEPGASEA